MLWYVVFVALFVTVPVSAVPSDSSNVVTTASTDTSTVVRRQKNPTICKYRSFNVIHFPCCTLIIQHSIHHIAQSIINNHSSYIFLLHALTSTGSSSWRYILSRGMQVQQYLSRCTSLTCLFVIDYAVCWVKYSVYLFVGWFTLSCMNHLITSVRIMSLVIAHYCSVPLDA